MKTNKASVIVKFSYAVGDRVLLKDGSKGYVQEAIYQENGNSIDYSIDNEAWFTSDDIQGLIEEASQKSLAKLRKLAKNV